MPVIALEWRIKEDVPLNLIAMKVAAEKYSGEVRLAALPSVTQTQRVKRETQWGADETLGMYIRSPVVRQNVIVLDDTSVIMTEKLNSVLKSITAARQSSTQ